MFRKSCCALLIAVLFIPALTSAQQPARPEREGDAPRSRDDRGMRPRRGGMAALINPARHLERMAEELKLTPEQKQKVSDLFDAYGTKREAVRSAFQMSPEERERHRSLAQELRAASEEGDKARVEQLRKESADLRSARLAKIQPAQKELEDATTKLQQDVLALLNPDQKPAFEAFWKDLSEGGRGTPPKNPRLLKHIVDKLDDLSKEQRQQIDDLFRAFHEEEREIRSKASDRKAEADDGAAEDVAGDRPRRGRRGPDRTIREQLQQRSEKLYLDITNVLNDEQKARVAEELKKAVGDRRGRGPRPPRGAGPRDSDR